MAAVAASARHAIAAASSGGIRLQSAIGSNNASADSRPFRGALSPRIGRAVEPGLTAFAATPVSRSSTARARIRPVTPAFDAR